MSIKIEKSDEYVQKLKESEERYKLFSNTVLEAVTIIENGLFTDASDIYFEMFRCEVEDVIGKPVLNFIPSHMQDIILRKIKEKDTPPYEAELLRHDGTIFPALIKGKRLNINERNVRLTTILDITERKNSEKALVKSENRYRRLVENLSKDYFFYTHGIDGVFTYVSTSVTNMLGYSQKEFMLHWDTYLTDNPINQDVEQKTDKAIQGLKQPPYMTEIFHESGERRWLEISEASVFDDDGKVIAVEGLAKDITDQKQMEEMLKHMANHDPLTELYNRKMFEQLLTGEIERASRYKHSLSVFMLDIDHFKSVNDNYGHQTGDIVLINFANILKSSIRKTDYAARYGGEEFIIILPETTQDKAEELAERLRKQIEESSFLTEEDKKFKVTTSIGIATFPDHAQTPEELLKAADTAMYAAKKAGRNQVKSP